MCIRDRYHTYISVAYEERGVSDTCHSSPSRTDPDSALQGQRSTNSSQGKCSGHIKSKPIPLKKSCIRQPGGRSDNNKGQLVDSLSLVKSYNLCIWMSVSKETTT